MNTKKAVITIFFGLLACFLIIAGVRHFTTADTPLVPNASRSDSSRSVEPLQKEPKVQYGLRRVNLDASYIGFDNLEALEEHADIIVVGTPVLPFAERENTATHYEDGMMQDFATLTDFTVEAVFKDTDQAVRDGQISFYEPIAITKAIDGAKALFTIADYRELQYGETYIVFLSANGSGSYSVINMSNGTFNLKKLDRTSGDPTHFKLMTQIFEKYDLE